MCGLAGVSRASFYRYLGRKAPREADMELRHQMQAISWENRFYGYRRVCAELRRKGFAVNHKKVLRLMKQDNLLALRKRKFVVTTDSKHTRTVYPNWAPTVQVTGPNQLWVADITYIRLQREFVYLAVVLDVYSRRVAGWCLGRSLQTSLCMTALERAIADRKPPPGWVHHSDRGVQYASAEYGEMLAQHKMMGSMSRAGCPYDNAYCESFMKTLKQEEVDGRKYTGLEHLELHGREVHRWLLQYAAVALGIRLSVAGRIRTEPIAGSTKRARRPAGLLGLSRTCGCRSYGKRGRPRMRFLRHAGIYQSDVA